MRRQSDRPDRARRRPAEGLEALEGRQLLTTVPGTDYYHSHYYIQPVVTKNVPPISVAHPIGTSTQKQLNALNEAQRIITGKDRQGNEYIITVHGPGSVVVTDATPNDGVLDDDIDTIQILDSTKDTVVTGQVSGSFRVSNNNTGVVFFNHLFANNPVGQIVLNGFTLARTLSTPLPTNPAPEIFLPGGVNYLSFHSIVGDINQTNNDPPYQIVIGDPNTPLATAPAIHLDYIQNFVYQGQTPQLLGVQPIYGPSTTPGTPTAVANGIPQTTPTVSIIVNGQIHGIEYVSSGPATLANGGELQNYPVVSTTGRTSIQAKGIGHLKVIGSANNTTASRDAQPFGHGFTGLDHINRAEFGGTTDAVGLDVNGPIKRLTYLRGSGNPAGTNLEATSFGQPEPTRGYSSFGFQGGRVRATNIGHVTIGAADLIRQTPTDPDNVQGRRQGTTKYFYRPGDAATNTTITASGSIGKTTIVGETEASEIRSGFHDPSFIAGLEPVRAASKIGPLRQRGDVIDAVVAATYRPGTSRTFGAPGNVAGPGTITGRLKGHTYLAGETTPLNNQGTGFYARHKKGYLPPPEAPIRNANGVIVR